MQSRLNKKVWGWALYDWANSAYATTVITAFFPIFYKQYWATSLDPTQSTFYLGLTMSISAFAFALSAPLLGAYADVYGATRRGLVLFATLGSLVCIALYFVPQGAWWMALLLYSLGWVFFSGGNLFYDALIVSVTKEEHYNWVSCFGYSLGYLGGGILIIVNALMVTQPALFGLTDTAQGVQWSFVSVGIWWFLFTLPILFWVPETKATRNRPTIRETFAEVAHTAMKIKSYKHLIWFLGAYFFYIDGVNTIYKMAVDFALSINLPSSDLIKAIILVQFIGFPATFIYSYLAQYIGTKRGICIGLFVYAGICYLGTSITTAEHFYMLAATLGLVQGGVQALSRSLFASLIPEESATEFFGFYNLFGKFSAILGPLLVGLTGLLTQSSRSSLLAVLILFIIGGSLLVSLPLKEKRL